jgi:16S rRNA (uracil1498-N3)-methyltransferase
MPRYDFRTPRLYLDRSLVAGAGVPLEAPQAHYLSDVLRLKPGDGVLAFNGRDGEWGGELAQFSKKVLAFVPERQTRVQTPPGDLHYLFAPLKRARLDYMVQKAVEMGVSKLAPVITHHTQAERVNTARMRANAIEAAEQCGVLTLPEIDEPLTLDKAVAALAPSRLLVFCDEAADSGNSLEVLSRHRPGGAGAIVPTAVLIGPEGGFSETERNLLSRRPNTVRIGLGPRILRADTAAVAALTVVQAMLGDWR